MRLRIARKMDQRRAERRDRRPWWAVYTDDQLRAAERRLRRSWVAHREATTLASGRRMWSIVPDWYAANRVHSRRVAQQAIRRLKQEQTGGAS